VGGSRTLVASGPPTLLEGCTAHGVHATLEMGLRGRVLRATAACWGPGTWLAAAAVMLLLLLRFQEWQKTAWGCTGRESKRWLGCLTWVSPCRCFAGRTGAELSPGL